MDADLDLVRNSNDIPRFLKVTTETILIFHRFIWKRSFVHLSMGAKNRAVCVLRIKYHCWKAASFFLPRRHPGLVAS